MPGVPKNVGNSGVCVCVRSATLEKRGNVCASAYRGAHAAAVAVAAPAPAALKKLLRDSLDLTYSMQPGAHTTASCVSSQCQSQGPMLVRQPAKRTIECAVLRPPLRGGLEA